MLYSAQPVINKTDKDGFTLVHNVPTFYIDGQIQMITSEEHAVKVVKAICNPLNDPSIVVHANVVPITWGLFDGPERIEI